MTWLAETKREERTQAAARSINIESSAFAFELLTRFETGQRCR